MTERKENGPLISGNELRHLHEYGREQTEQWFITWGENLIKPRDPNAPPPSFITRIRWRLDAWAYRIETAPSDIRWWAATKLRRLADRIE